MTKRNNSNSQVSLHLPRWSDLPSIGLYMDQVLSLINPYFQENYGGSYSLTSTMVNNYVKVGVIPSPVKRRYNRESIARLFVIITLKSLFNVNEISQLIEALAEGHELSEGYDLYCDTLERAIASTYEDSTSHVKPDDDYLRVLEDTAIAAAYQLIVKRRLFLRSSRQEATLNLI